MTIPQRIYSKDIVSCIWNDEHMEMPICLWEVNTGKGLHAHSWGLGSGHSTSGQWVPMKPMELIDLGKHPHAIIETQTEDYWLCVYSNPMLLEYRNRYVNKFKHVYDTHWISMLPSSSGTEWATHGLLFSRRCLTYTTAWQNMQAGICMYSINQRKFLCWVKKWGDRKFLFMEVEITAVIELT